MCTNLSNKRYKDTERCSVKGAGLSPPIFLLEPGSFLSGVLFGRKKREKNRIFLSHFPYVITQLWVSYPSPFIVPKVFNRAVVFYVSVIVDLPPSLSLSLSSMYIVSSRTHPLLH